MAAVSLLQKWQLLQAILADAELSATAKLVAARLLYHHSAQTGRCSPSYQTIADGIALKRRAVIYAVQELESARWITLARVKGGYAATTKGYVTNGFRINFDRSSDVGSVHGDAPSTVHGDAPAPGAPPCTPPGARNDTPPVHGGALPPVHGGAPDSGKDTGKGNREESPPTPSAFDRWWQAYPLKAGELAAREAYDRVLRRGLAEPEVLITGAKRYADAVAGRDSKFIKEPRNWLAGGHWADEPAPRHVTAVANGRQPFSALDALRSNFCDDE